MGNRVTARQIRTNLKYALQDFALNQHASICRSMVGEYQDSLARLFFRNHQRGYSLSRRYLPNEALTGTTWQEILVCWSHVELVNIPDGIQSLCQGFFVWKTSKEAEAKKRPRSTLTGHCNTDASHVIGPRGKGRPWAIVDVVLSLSQPRELVPLLDGGYP